MHDFPSVIVMCCCNSAYYSNFIMKFSLLYPPHTDTLTRTNVLDGIQFELSVPAKLLFDATIFIWFKLIFPNFKHILSCAKHLIRNIVTYNSSYKWISFYLKMFTFLETGSAKNPPILQTYRANGFCGINFQYTNIDVQTYLI